VQVANARFLTLGIAEKKPAVPKIEIIACHFGFLGTCKESANTSRPCLSEADPDVKKKICFDLISLQNNYTTWARNLIFRRPAVRYDGARALVYALTQDVVPS
jgi:hypothetical protein